MDPQTLAWETALVKTFGVHQRRYGTRRLQVALREKGHRVGRQRLRTAMRRRGLRALQPKAYTPRTTDSTHGLRCAPNRLLDQPKPTRANQISGCPTARTCRWTAATGSYPAGPICALFRTWGPSTWWVVPSRAVGATMPEELVTTALQRAFFAQPPTPELIVHSDRGGQYCGNAYRALLHQHGAVRWQSRRGECYDNAQAESLWSRLKTEVLELRE